MLFRVSFYMFRVCLGLFGRVVFLATRFLPRSVSGGLRHSTTPCPRTRPSAVSKVRDKEGAGGKVRPALQATKSVQLRGKAYRAPRRSEGQTSRPSSSVRVWRSRAISRRSSSFCSGDCGSRTT